MKKIKAHKYTILINLSKYIFLFVILVTLVAPVAFAATSTTGTGITSTIANPLGEGNLDTLPKFIEKIIEIVLYIGVPIIALAIIYTGFLFVKAQGAPEEISRAKKALVYTLVGGAILLGAFVIAKAIGATVKDIATSA